jgi:predicted transcriptional regulator
MQDTITQQLDEKDMEYAKILNGRGIPVNQSLVIVALVHENNKTQNELSVMIGTPQSGVSVALKGLVNAGWVEIYEGELSDIKKRGRPVALYVLQSWESVVDHIERTAIRSHEKSMKDIERLKELAE